jgi:hypothetical protein
MPSERPGSIVYSKLQYDNRDNNAFSQCIKLLGVLRNETFSF